MNVLVLGTGLLGSHIAKLYPEVPVLSHKDCDITNPFDIYAVTTHYKPDVVINCAGIVPRSNQYDDTMTVLKTNAQGPLLLQTACDEIDCRLIQISTDCVFSGRRGSYCEIDIPDPNSIYGISKYLGEVREYPHLTIRTSFIGLPDEPQRGLLAWASHQQEIVGFDSYLWNGLTATELARMLFEKIIPRQFTNIIHVYGQETLSKYDMLVQAKEVFGWNVDIKKESDLGDIDKHDINRTLSSELADLCVKKSFRQMLLEMKTLHET